MVRPMEVLGSQTICGSNPTIDSIIFLKNRQILLCCEWLLIISGSNPVKVEFLCSSHNSNLIKNESRYNYSCSIHSCSGSNFIDHCVYYNNQDWMERFEFSKLYWQSWFWWLVLAIVSMVDIYVHDSWNFIDFNILRIRNEIKIENK